MAANVKRLMGHYCLRFAAIDMAIGTDAKWYFFEVNANGQWAWMDLAGATNIASSITCIEVGPRRVTHKLRRRARHHRLLARKLRLHLPPVLGEAFCRQRYDFANFLDFLADEMWRLSEWPMAV